MKTTPDLYMKIIQHLHDKVDITLIAAITLLGFMIASLAILKSVMPIQIVEVSTLYNDVITIFKKALNYLFITIFLSIIGFFLYDIPYIKYISFVAYIAFIISLYYVYKSTTIIFIIDKNQGSKK